MHMGYEGKLIVCAAVAIVGCGDDQTEDRETSEGPPTGPLTGTIDGGAFVPAMARARFLSDAVYVEMMSVDADCMIALPPLSEEPVYVVTVRFAPGTQQPGSYEIGEPFMPHPSPGTVPVAAGWHKLNADGMPSQKSIGLGPGDGKVYVDAWGEATVRGALDVDDSDLGVALRGTFEAPFCPETPGP